MTAAAERSGPRPTLLDQIEKYDEFERLRLEVRPWCTGLAQTHGGATIPWPERIRYDVYYVARASLWIDLWIMLMTPVAILRGEHRGATAFGESGCAEKMPRR